MSYCCQNTNQCSLNQCMEKTVPVDELEPAAMSDFCNNVAVHLFSVQGSQLIIGLSLVLSPHRESRGHHIYTIQS